MGQWLGLVQWDSKVTKQRKRKKPNTRDQILFALLLPEPAWVLSGTFFPSLLSRLAKFLSNSSNPKANCGYRSMSVSAIIELHILTFPSTTTKQS